MSKKYPLVVFTYAGPTYQLAKERYSLDFNTYLASSEQVICATIDGRGSGAQGDEMTMEVYKDLGGPETQDQIEVTRKIVEANPFIDTDKIAIWGWSYGGFNTLSVLANDPYGIFKCGMAVAPISNWIYYDTIYTERYMGLPTPEDNLAGYMRSDLTSKAANFKGKKLLLAHGMAGMKLE